MIKRKFLIVSNRLPVTVYRIDGKLEFIASSGGLPTAMSRLREGDKNSLWIGWPGIESDGLTANEKSQIIKKLKTFGCYPIFLTKLQVEKYYEGYSNDTIWPLFHYFQSYIQHDTTYWTAYKKVNEVFRSAVLKHSDKNTKIWIHDYHLMLLPQLIRKSIPGSTIGFFLHTPFPSYEIYRLLPHRSEILEGLLGADLIGFHIYDYARHFLSSVLRVLGVENKHGTIEIGDRIAKVDAFPIGIDYEKFEMAHKDPKIIEEINALERYHAGKKIILSVDRLDYSKGIIRRLEAYEQFLRENPGCQKKIVLVVVAVPSRTEIETYKLLKNKIEETISSINGTYGTIDWTPISYQFKNLPFEQVAALFRVSDIALLTPLRDGMNLVAKEYISTKQNRPGVLILSEMTGAVDELPEAIRINPNDINAIVAAIKTAIKMPKNVQLEKIKSMQARLSKYTVKRWSEDFVEQLEQSKNWQKQRSRKLLTDDSKVKLIKSFKQSKKRLILLDYDGTLRSFVSSHEPKLAAPPQKIKNLIKKLSQIKNTEVCIVSGRPRTVIDGWFGDLDIAMVAEHGAWIKSEGEWSRQEISLGKYRDKILTILEQYAERTPGSRIEEKEFSIVWHYRNVPTELAQARNAGIAYELRQLLSNTEFDIYSGQKIIEIKPSRINKGVAVEDLYAMHSPDFVLCIGDDYTDEDMFKALPEDSYTIKVGLDDTNARYQLVDVDAVLRLLSEVV